MLGKCLQPFYVKQSGFYAPCGKCAYCLSRRKSDWTTRCSHELTHSDFGYFITLTYDQDHIPEKYSLRKKDFQDFMKRFRYYIGKSCSYTIKYFAAGEYGTKTHRPHYHAAVFFRSRVQKQPLLSAQDFSNQRMVQAHIVSLFTKAWDKGHVEVSQLNKDRCAYTVGYCQKKLFQTRAYSGKVERPFQLTSSGIGRSYCLSCANTLRRNLCLHINGYVKALPRYYRKLLGLTAEAFKENLSEMQEKLAEKYRSLTGKSPYTGVYPNADVNRIALKLGFYDGKAICTGEYLDWLFGCAKQLNDTLLAKIKLRTLQKEIL